MAAASSEPEWHYADAYWRWDIDDRGPDDPSVFTGTVRAKWELHSSCDDSGIKGHSPTISSSRLNGHDDYLDPNTINIYNHAKSSGLFTCNAQSRVDFTIHRHGKYGKQTMILRFPDVSSTDWLMMFACLCAMVFLVLTISLFDPQRRPWKFSSIRYA